MRESGSLLPGPVGQDRLSPTALVDYLIANWLVKETGLAVSTAIPAIKLLGAESLTWDALEKLAANSSRWFEVMTRKFSIGFTSSLRIIMAGER
jgi:hypothetical protein